MSIVSQNAWIRIILAAVIILFIFFAQSMSSGAWNMLKMAQNTSKKAPNILAIAFNASKTAQIKSKLAPNTSTMAENTSTMAPNTSKMTSSRLRQMTASTTGLVTSTTALVTSTTAQSTSATAQIKSKNSLTRAKPPVIPNCSSKPDGLKTISESTVETFSLSIIEAENENPLVKEGGHFKPSKCIAKKVAILIPYRNRLKHLHRFLYFMHPVLQHQQLEYKIFVINQSNQGKFNRAKLLNVGFVEAIKDFGAECFVFHDVDTVLIDESVTYSCSLPTPRHLTSFQRTYVFGGVTQMTKAEFNRVNGYPNRFWGWGGEDDDLFNRIKATGMKVYSDKNAMQHFYRKHHPHDTGNEANPERFDLLRNTAAYMYKDGLNTLKYKVISNEAYKLYTNITVNVVYGEEAQMSYYSKNMLNENLKYHLNAKT